MPRQKPAVLHREEVTPKTVVVTTTRSTTTTQQQIMEERKRSSPVPPFRPRIAHRDERPTEATTHSPSTRQQQTFEERRWVSSTPSPVNTFVPRRLPEATTERTTHLTRPQRTFTEEATTERTTHLTRPQRTFTEPFTPRPSPIRPLLPEKARHEIEDVPKTDQILVKPLEPLRENIQPRVDRVPAARAEATSVAPNEKQDERLISATFRESPNSDQLPPTEVLEKSQQPRQQSVATHPHVYKTSSISNYNPQQNNNLAGLSPPVDPTYFTYNSQHLGGRGNRQFVANNMMFNRQLPPARTNWNQFSVPGHGARAWAPQTFSALAPNQQFQPILQTNQFGQAQPHVPQLTIRNPSDRAANHAGSQQSPGLTNFTNRGAPLAEVSLSVTPENTEWPSATPSVPQSHAVTQQGANSLVKPEHSPLEPNTFNTPEAVVQPTAQSRATNPSSSSTQHTVPSFAAEQPRVFDANLQSPKPSFVPQDSSSRKETMHHLCSGFKLFQATAGQSLERPQFPISPQASGQLSNSQREQQVNRNWAEPFQQSPEQHQPFDQNRNAHNVPSNKQAEIKTVKQQSTPNHQIPEEQVVQTDGPHHNEFPKRTIENNRMVISSRPKVGSPVEQNIIETKSEWERVNAQRTLTERRNFHSDKTKVAALSDDDESEEFPANIDRSRFIYYNGDYYAPTIPGIRVPRPDLENSPQNEPVSILEGPPKRMFREFRQHSNEFKKTAPLLSGGRFGSGNFLSIMNKSRYLKEEGSVNNAPPVRVPDKRPRKLQELSEHLTSNEYPEFLRAPQPNSTRTRPMHTLNQVTQVHDSLYDNFPRHMQHINTTLTESITNQAPNDRANHPMPLNIQPITSFTGIISDDDEEDLSDEIPRRAAGVAQARNREPIGIEHHHAASPSLKTLAHPQAVHEMPHVYGETNKPLKKIEILPKSIITASAPTVTANVTDSTVQSTTVDTTLAKHGGTSAPNALRSSSFELSSSEETAGYAVGREPVPLSPVGIGRNMERLDIDGLEEPTTIIPLSTSTSTTAANADSATSSTAAVTSAQQTSSPVSTPKMESIKESPKEPSPNHAGFRDPSPNNNPIDDSSSDFATLNDDSFTINSFNISSSSINFYYTSTNDAETNGTTVDNTIDVHFSTCDHQNFSKWNIGNSSPCAGNDDVAESTN
ncbi:hypothetical protein COOONC_00885 [Cooperia oncophora]